jgi:hypothetical protein
MLMESVRDCDSGTELSNSKKMKKSSHEEVDPALLQWFNQKQVEGTSASGPTCAQKARLSASTGWLTRFKQQYGICIIAVQG